MSAEADDAQARKDARRAPYKAQERRGQAKIFIGLAPLWVVIAGLRWLDDDASALSRWLMTAVAVGQVGVAFLHWWRFLRHPLP